MGHPTTFPADTPRFATRSTARLTDSTTTHKGLVDGIRRIDDFAHGCRESEEGDDFLPCAPPALGD
jgi:hypothetical protein